MLNLLLSGKAIHYTHAKVCDLNSFLTTCSVLSHVYLNIFAQSWKTNCYRAPELPFSVCYAQIYFAAVSAITRITSKKLLSNSQFSDGSFQPSQCAIYHNICMVNQTIKNFIDAETETLLESCSWNSSELNKYVWNKLTPHVRLEITGTPNSGGSLHLIVLVVRGKKNCRCYTTLGKASEIISTSWKTKIYKEMQTKSPL